LTAEEVLKRLEEAWSNEKNAPDLLEPKMEIVECMLEQITTMEQNLESLQKGDLRLSVHKMELSRIKFVINSYLRTRLTKIQNNFFHYSQTSKDNPSRMTPEEADFLESYQECVGELFQNLCLKHLQVGLDLTKTNTKPPKPNTKSAVFINALEEVKGLEVRDESGSGRDETLDLEVGDQQLIQYSTIAHLVESGAVKLV